MSFVEGMIGNYLRGLSPAQRSQLLRTAQQEFVANTTPEEREYVVREFLRALLASLTAEQRARLAIDLEASLHGGE